MLNFLNNRPITPHISVYLIQFYSFISIMHRFSALLLVVFIWVFLSFYNFVYNLFLFKITLKIILMTLSFFNFIKLIIYLLFLYHFFNGIRYIFFYFYV